MEYNVKYSVTVIDADGEEGEEMRESIAVVDYATKYIAATFYDPAEGGDLEWHFELPDGSPDTFAEENCSDYDRDVIEDYMAIGDDWFASKGFRKRHGWED